MKNNRKNSPAFKKAVSFLVAFAAAFLVSVLFIAALGVNPFKAYAKLVTGALGRKSSIFEIFAKATPFIIMSLGVSISVKGGLSNLGGDGQYLFAAIASVCVGLYMPAETSRWIIWLLAALVAVVAGGLYGGLAGFLKTRFHTNEVIITIMLNYVAEDVVSYLVSGPLQAPGGIPQTKAIPPRYYIPKVIPRTRANYGFIVALLLAVLVWFLFRRTVAGYKIEALGASPQAARYGGISEKRTITRIMALSGAFCGLAGMIEVYGNYYRVLDGITSSFGFTAMMIALLAKLSPFAAVLASVFISVLMVGANSMQIAMNVPTSIVNVIQSLIIVFILIMPNMLARICARRKNRVRREAVK